MKTQRVSAWLGLLLIFCLLLLGWLTMPSNELAAAAPPSASRPAARLAPNPDPPTTTAKLIFIHHSTGENWLADVDESGGTGGGLGTALRDNNYFVSDTNYGWGPPDADIGSDTIGDHTDIGHWYNWFAGPHRATYLAALYPESETHATYARRDTDPGGDNQIVLFKSCFPNSGLGGAPNDPPTTGDNPLRGQDSGSEHMTVGNAKGIYNDLLTYFVTRPDKLFVVIAAPPLRAEDTSPEAAANARAFNTWLVNDWLATYPQINVAVFDFYNVLTSNGGNPDSNDLGAETGNHHRWRNGAVEHTRTIDNNTSSYPTGDSHPSPAGGQKASGEFVPLLNIAYNRWRGQAPVNTPTPTPPVTPTITPTATATPTPTVTRSVRVYLPLTLRN
jgi:hypothetical protein